MYHVKKDRLFFNYFRLIVCLSLIFCLNNYSFSQSQILKSNRGLWQIKEVKNLQNDTGILSEEILRETRKRTKNLQKLIGHILYYKDSTLFFGSLLQNKLYSGDTIFFFKTLIYKVVADDRSTLKYPGDELSDTSSNNRFIGVSFIKLLGLKESNYLKVIIGDDPKNKLSIYRLCEIDQNKIALILLDQNILLICERIHYY